ncbi:DUF6233 domain-containing protein [Streptomyces sp. NBC_00247]|uniref:DUF6233 domain-containing protein n=1 Tax=Streptomyces sp. NBC_00247 TaxID=2975689 RepID=UPI002E2D6BE3|nr:DUF6233 domain-containing protein [Streptomyces sp. NBC_00247]
MAEISDLDKNRVVEQHLVWQLRQERGRIQELERQEAEDRRRAAVAREENAWRVEPKGTGHRDYAVLHRGGCTLGRRGGLIPRAQAVLALSEDYIRCCKICTPETGLKGNQ